MIESAFCITGISYPDIPVYIARIIGVVYDKQIIIDLVVVFHRDVSAAETINIVDGIRLVRQIVQRVSRFIEQRAATVREALCLVHDRYSLYLAHSFCQRYSRKWPEHSQLDQAYLLTFCTQPVYSFFPGAGTGTDDNKCNFRIIHHVFLKESIFSACQLFIPFCNIHDDRHSVLHGLCLLTLGFHVVRRNSVRTYRQWVF